MYGTMKEHLEDQLARIDQEGLYKRERVIAGPQQSRVDVAGRRVLNMCANNYLGLAGHPEIVETRPGGHCHYDGRWQESSNDATCARSRAVVAPLQGLEGWSGWWCPAPSAKRRGRRG